jgi:CBS domain-containing protein
MKSAAQIMTSHVTDIAPDAPVAEAIDKMKQDNISSLLIKTEGGMATWGFMTETDIIEKVVAKGLNPADICVVDIMSRPVITVAPTYSLQECAATMARARIRRVLVYDGHNIVGIVSTSDIFSAL